MVEGGGLSVPDARRGPGSVVRYPLQRHTRDPARRALLSPLSTGGISGAVRTTCRELDRGLDRVDAISYGRILSRVARGHIDALRGSARSLLRRRFGLRRDDAHDRISRFVPDSHLLRMRRRDRPEREGASEGVVLGRLQNGGGAERWEKAGLMMGPDRKDDARWD